MRVSDRVHRRIFVVLGRVHRVQLPSARDELPAHVSAWCTGVARMGEIEDVRRGACGVRGVRAGGESRVRLSTILGADRAVRFIEIAAAH